MVRFLSVTIILAVSVLVAASRRCDLSSISLVALTCVPNRTCMDDRRCKTFPATLLPKVLIEKLNLPFDNKSIASIDSLMRETKYIA